MKMAVITAAFLAAIFISGAAFAQQSADLSPGSSHLIAPEALVKVLQSTTGVKPLILNVGPWLIYRQAHIPGSEYIGAGSDKQALEQLRTRVKSLPRTQYIVLYCGCCPWDHCPNVRPAFEQLQSLKFTNVKVLYIANNFGADWVDKGYPSVRGQ